MVGRRRSKPEDNHLDYFLTEEQRMIQELAAQIATEKIRPVRAQLDEQEEFPWE
ncbi:MAG: acyl-CoA dehydrogenase family protein, partial [Syntrophobacteraceae bacterium]